MPIWRSLFGNDVSAAKTIIWRLFRNRRQLFKRFFFEVRLFKLVLWFSFLPIDGVDLVFVARCRRLSFSRPTAGKLVEGLGGRAPPIV